jgi:hypothetical protein
MDRFPEAFKRFEEVVDVDRIESFRQLHFAFASWSGRKWHDTYMQNRALAVEARKHGIPLEGFFTGRVERRVVASGGAVAGRETATKVEVKFSRNYATFSSWSQKTSRTSAYQKRVANYLKAHPNATLSEARGHRKRS